MRAAQIVTLLGLYSLLVIVISLIWAGFSHYKKRFNRKSIYLSIVGLLIFVASFIAVAFLEV